MEDKRPIAIYSRKSKFTGKGESIENQLEMCRRHIAMLWGDDALQCVHEYEDEGYSGGTLKRPQFQRLMRDMRAGEYRALVVYRLDRVSRNIGDFAGLIEELTARGIQFISLKESFDTSSPMGRAMMYICSVFSQLERETIAERIRDNLYELAKTGRWLGGTTPLGYESESVSSVSVDGKTRRAFKLRVVPEEAELVRLIYATYLEIGSLTGTDTALLQKGITTRKGKQFKSASLARILDNPVYVAGDTASYHYLKELGVQIHNEEAEFDGSRGIMPYNRTKTGANKEQIMTPPSEWVVALGQHEGIIPSDTWLRAQRMLERNGSKAFRRPRNHAALLGGIFRCAHCGGLMRPRVRDRNLPNGERVYDYMCETRERGRGELCQVRSCHGNEVDAFVLAKIKELASDHEQLATDLRKYAANHRSRREGYEAEIRLAEKALADNERHIAEMVAALGKATDTVAEQYILRSISDLHEKKCALTENIEDLRKFAAQASTVQEEVDAMLATLSNFAQRVDSMTVEEKRSALRLFLDRVTWDGASVEITLFGAEHSTTYGVENSPSCNDSSCSRYTADYGGKEWVPCKQLSPGVWLMSRRTEDGMLYAARYTASYRFQLLRRDSVPRT